MYMIDIKSFDKTTHELVKEQKLASFDELYHYPDRDNYDITIKSDLWDKYKDEFHNSLDNEQDFNMSIMNIIWYLNDEFEESHEQELLNNLDCIGLAYTTSYPMDDFDNYDDYVHLFGEEDYEFQINLNLFEHTVYYYYNDIEVHKEHFNSLKELNEMYLENLNFDDLIYDYLTNDDYLEVLIGKEKDRIIDEVVPQLIEFIEENDYYEWLDNEGFNQNEMEIEELKNQLKQPESLKNIYESLSDYQDEILEENIPQLEGLLEQLSRLSNELEDDGMSL